MVKKYNKKPVAKKRMFRRKFVKAIKRGYMPRSVTTMANIPPMQRFRYCDTVTLTPPLGGNPVGVAYSANSLNRPYVTGGTQTQAHQPLRYDQIGVFYQRNIVLGSKITVKTLGTQSTASGLTQVVGYLQLTNATTYTTEGYIQDIEQGKSRWKLLNNSDDNKASFYCTFSAKKWFKLKDVRDDQAQVGANWNANPSQEAYYLLLLQNTASTAVGTPFTFVITIDYIALCSQPNDISLS